MPRENSRRIRSFFKKKIGEGKEKGESPSTENEEEKRDLEPKQMNKT